MAGRVYNVSPSLLAEVRKCSLRGHTRHVLGYTSIGDAIKAKAGQAFHAGMAVYLDPILELPATEVEGQLESTVRRRAALNSLHAVYDTAFIACPPEQLDDAYTPQNLHRLFDRWMELHPPVAVPWKRVIEVETAFISRQWMVKGDGVSNFELVEIPMNAGVVDAGLYDVVRLILRPDALVETTDGYTRYVDTKTTGWRVTDQSWSRALRMSLQTQLYADGVVQRFGEKAQYAGWLNAVEIRKLPGDPTRKCAQHKVFYAECGNEHAKAVILNCESNAGNVGKAVLEAKRAATQFVKLQRFHEANKHLDMADYPMAEIPTEGMSNEACKFCPAVEFCESGAYPQSLAAMMKFDPWVVDVNKREHPTTENR